jgi:tRNA (guanine-N7-)-methyltransferase
MTHLLLWKRRVAKGEWHCDIDWDAEFGRHAPLDVEIGCGNGMWLREHARRNPARNVIGNEIVGKFLKEVDRRTVRDNEHNVRLLIGDARTASLLCFGDGQVARMFVNFPDPWFKKRHLKRRLLNPTFLSLLSRKTVRGGDLTVATDDADYAAFVRECVADVPAWQPEFSGSHIEELPEYPETKYERKWRAMGRSIFYFRYRNSEPALIDNRTYIAEQHLDYAMHLLGAGGYASPKVADSEHSAEEQAA